ncbi:hypothetical protein JKG68_28095 [Microvirga aerilata]|uniref:Uncharacterized protein n=1 Tax=Microvirga aerilata TaxID=670292 RepID=A0A936ZIE8_9HYPH|nr:hypothetical protein [Microvirga aerilata]MBL0407772.1 hypothetical protein [Microvirga aerilata]
MVCKRDCTGSVTERIANAVALGRAPDEADLAILKAQAFELSFDRGEFWTHVLPKDSSILFQPQDREDWSSLDEVLPEERLEQLSAGAEPSPDETELLRAVSAANLLARPDDDITPGLWTIGLDEGPNPAIAVVACQGHSFSGVNRWLLGVYGSRTEARSLLENEYIFPV